MQPAPDNAPTEPAPTPSRDDQAREILRAVLWCVNEGRTIQPTSPIARMVELWLEGNEGEER